MQYQKQYQIKYQSFTDDKHAHTQKGLFNM